LHQPGSRRRDITYQNFITSSSPVNGYQDPRIDGGEVVTTMPGRVEGCL